MELFRSGFLPAEKGKGARGRLGRWYHEWPSRGVLFLPAQVIEDLVYGVLVLNTPVRRIDDDPD
jgi:hypothetical protein